jgi:drug/metabolite transporter (DMT)-like permease
MRREFQEVIVAAYAAMCLIWGTTWYGIRVSLEYVPPIAGAGLRFLLAGLALYAVAAWRGRLTPPARLPWKLVLVFAAFLFGLNYILTYTSETRLDSGLVSVLFGTMPFFVFALGALAGEQTTPLIWAGAVVAFAGVAVISLGGEVRGSPLYALGVIAAAASSAFANVYAKRHSGHDPLVTLPPAMLIAGVTMTVIGAFAQPVVWTRALSLPSLEAILYLALFGSGIAFFLNIWVIKHIPVWIVGLSSLIIPIIAVFVGAFAGGEHVTLREICGTLLVIGGVGIALLQWFRNAPA